jgi:hypothetical protein
LAYLKVNLTLKELPQNWQQAFGLVILMDLMGNVIKPNFYLSIGEFQNPKKELFFLLCTSSFLKNIGSFDTSLRRQLLKY